MSLPLDQTLPSGEANFNNRTNLCHYSEKQWNQLRHQVTIPVLSNKTKNKSKNKKRMLGLLILILEIIRSAIFLKQAHL